MAIIHRKNGYVIKVGTYALKYIKTYSAEWLPVYNTDNIFQNFNGESVNEAYMGQRYTASITTSAMPESEANELISQLQGNTVYILDAPKDGEVTFSGACRITNYSREPVTTTPTERYFRVSFSVSAVALKYSSSGGL